MSAVEPKAPLDQAGNVRVFLAGEGANELGSRAGHPSYQSDERPGVLAALLTKVQAEGWVVGGAREWKSIRKLRTGRGGHEDIHNVLGVALDAKEAACDVLAFLRDMDKDPERKEAIQEGIRRAPAGLEVIGGVAVPTLEGWMLALLGVGGTEAMTPARAENELEARGVRPKDGAAMVCVVEGAELAGAAPDAIELGSWLKRAADVLPTKVAARAASGR